MKVQIIGVTQFYAPSDVPWQPDADSHSADSLPEFAGRACYQSWHRPNPKTATNAGYLEHILDVGHFSVLEHSSVSFYVTGVSRSLTHELVRHRHLSFSQLSQRYVPGMQGAVCPDIVREDPELWATFADAMEHASNAYDALKAGLDAKLRDEPDVTMRKKLSRQAARSVLPNAAETRIVVTGNLRAWRQFIDVRATEHADVEIRELALRILAALREVAPNSFQDYMNVERAGVEIATRTILPDDDFRDFSTQPDADDEERELSDLAQELPELYAKDTDA